MRLFIGSADDHRHGVEVAVVLSYKEYRQLTTSREKLSDLIRRSPLAEVDIELFR